MRDLSIFEDEQFDLIINGISTHCVDEIQPIWTECFRVLKYDGKKDRVGTDQLPFELLDNKPSGSYEINVEYGIVILQRPDQIFLNDILC